MIRRVLFLALFVLALLCGAIYAQPIPGLGNALQTNVTPTVEFCSSNSTPSPAFGTATYTSQAICPASTDRLVVVASISPQGGVVPAITSMTIGGISASKTVATAVADGQAEIWQAVVPTGTTGTIVINFSPNTNRNAIGVWAVRGYRSATATATFPLTNQSASPVVLNVNVIAGGVVIASAGCNGGGGAGNTWSGVTEDFDIAVNSDPIGGASLSVPNGATPQTASVTLTGSCVTQNVGVSAAWR